MELKRLTPAFCIISIIMLFMQCEKREMTMSEISQPLADDVCHFDAKKKPENPGKPDKPSSEYVVISGDVTGEGCYTYMQPFTLTLGSHYGEDSGTFEGDAIWINYSTKKHGENRIDFWYMDDGVEKFFHIRQPNPSNAYDPVNRTLTFNEASTSLVAIRDGTGDNFTPYDGASVIVHFSDCP